MTARAVPRMVSVRGKAFRRKRSWNSRETRASARGMVAAMPRTSETAQALRPPRKVARPICRNRSAMKTPETPGPISSATAKRSKSRGVRSHCSRLSKGGSKEAASRTSVMKKVRSSTSKPMGLPSMHSPIPVPNATPVRIHTHRRRGCMMSSAMVVPLRGQKILQPSPSANLLRMRSAAR
jgi:hypothetical protein